MENERSRIESMARASWLAAMPSAPAPTYIPDLTSRYDTPAPVYPPIAPTPSTSGDDSEGGDGSDGSGNNGDDSGNANE